MSEPSAMTGLPDPHLAIQPVGTPAKPRCTVKPFFSRTLVRYFDVSTSWNPSSPKLNTWSTICCVNVDMLSMSRVASVLRAVIRASSCGMTVGNGSGCGGPPRPPRCAYACDDTRRTSETASAVMRRDLLMERLEGGDRGFSDSARAESSGYFDDANRIVSGASHRAFE